MTQERNINERTMKKFTAKMNNEIRKIRLDNKKSIEKIDMIIEK